MNKNGQTRGDIIIMNKNDTITVKDIKIPLSDEDCDIEIKCGLPYNISDELCKLMNIPSKWARIFNHNNVIVKLFETKEKAKKYRNSYIDLKNCRVEQIYPNLKNPNNIIKLFNILYAITKMTYIDLQSDRNNFQEAFLYKFRDDYLAFNNKENIDFFIQRLNITEWEY